MSGLNISKSLFENFVFPLLNKEFIEALPFLSVAFLGEGSEVLGFDDEISRDHNFTPRVVIFVKDEKFYEFGRKIKEKLIENAPIKISNISLIHNSYCNSIEVVSLKKYLYKYLNIKSHLIKKIDWLKLDEQKLLEITSGEIFYDSGNQLKKIIDYFKIYPENIRWFLIYQGFVRISESDGIVRNIIREDYIAVNLYQSFYIYFIIKTFHLLKKQYCPYRKWMGRSLENLGKSGIIFHRKVEKLAKHSELKEIKKLIIDCMTYLSKCIFKELNVKRDDFWIETELNLLNFNYELMFKEINKKIPYSLKKLNPVISPKSFWGILFSMDGLGMNFEETLRKNIELFDK